MGYEVEHVCFGSNRELSETIISIIKDLRELSKTQRRIQKKFNTFIVNNMKTTERLKTDQDVHNFIKKKTSCFFNL